MEYFKPSVESFDLPVSHAVKMLNFINNMSRKGGISPEEFEETGQIYQFIKTNLKLEKVKNETSESSQKLDDITE